MRCAQESDVEAHTRGHGKALTSMEPEPIRAHTSHAHTGASQPHKHMQIAPSSAPVLDTVVSSVPCCTEKGSSAVHRSPILPVRHGFVCLPEGVDSAGLESAYDMLARDLGVPLLERYEQTQDKVRREDLGWDLGRVRRVSGALCMSCNLRDWLGMCPQCVPIRLDSMLK